jgi:SPP1 gp7 family putative phage head morphogenesis protein
MPEIKLTPRTPPEQLAFFEAKGYRLEPSWDWQAWAAEDHAAAFTVAKSAGFDILNDIYSAALQAQANNWTKRQFEDALTPLLQAKGWWGRQEMTAPDGSQQMVQLGSPSRLGLIFDTNMRTARAAGHWSRIEALADRRPWLRYTCIIDGRTRPQHKAWHGIIRRWDDDFWATHAPPNGWRCRCSIRQMSDAELQLDGLTPSPSPDVSYRPWTNKVTRETVQVPVGIDPGWAHNPGRLAVDIHAARALATKLDGLPTALALDAAEASARFVSPALARGYRQWAEPIVSRSSYPSGEAIPIGLLPSVILKAAKDAGLGDVSPVLSISQKQLVHMVRDAKAAATSRTGAAKGMSSADVLRLPELIAQARAIYLDGSSLIYEVPSSEPGRSGKVVVKLDYIERERLRGNRIDTRSARIITVGLTDSSSLKGYNLLWRK